MVLSTSLYDRLEEVSLPYKSHTVASLNKELVRLDLLVNMLSTCLPENRSLSQLCALSTELQQKFHQPNRSHLESRLSNLMTELSPDDYEKVNTIIEQNKTVSSLFAVITYDRRMNLYKHRFAADKRQIQDIQKLAMGLIKQKRFAHAFRVCEFALPKDVNQASRYMIKKICKQEHLELARELLTRVSSEVPETHYSSTLMRALRYIAKTELTQGREEDLIASYSQFKTTLDRNSASLALFRRALDLKKFEIAAQFLDQAEICSEKREEAEESLIDKIIDTGNINQVIDIAETLPKYKQLVLFRLAELLHHLGKHLEAIAVSKRLDDHWRNQAYFKGLAVEVEQRSKRINELGLSDKDLAALGNELLRKGRFDCCMEAYLSIKHCSQKFEYFVGALRFLIQRNIEIEAIPFVACLKVDNFPTMDGITLAKHRDGLCEEIIERLSAKTDGYYLDILDWISDRQTFNRIIWKSAHVFKTRAKFDAALMWMQKADPSIEKFKFQLSLMPLASFSTALKFASAIENDRYQTKALLTLLPRAKDHNEVAAKFRSSEGKKAAEQWFKNAHSYVNPIPPWVS